MQRSGPHFGCGPSREQTALGFAGIADPGSGDGVTGVAHALGNGDAALLCLGRADPVIGLTLSQIGELN